MDKDYIKHLEEIKDQQSSIEMRLFDTKQNRVVNKLLTNREVMAIVANMDNIEWHDLPRKEGK